MGAILGLVTNLVDYNAADTLSQRVADQWFIYIETPPISSAEPSGERIVAIWVNNANDTFDFHSAIYHADGTVSGNADENTITQAELQDLIDALPPLGWFARIDGPDYTTNFDYMGATG